MEGYSVAELLDDLRGYNNNKTKLRQLFGPIILHKLQSDPVFMPGLSTVLSGFATGIPAYIPQADVDLLKRAAADDRKEDAIRDFNIKYGQGSAEYILRM